MHLGIYRAAPAVRAIIHTHPPFATALSVLALSDLHDLGGLLPEGDILLGEVALVPYRTPGTAQMAGPLLPLLSDHCAAILRNHGALTWGPDLETAYVLTETLEAVCRVACQARQFGVPRRLEPEQREELARLRARWRSGGPAAHGPDAR